VEIEKTEDDELFWSYRSGKQFSFSRAVADGNYSLWLEFAEPMASAAGERTFDVWAEGKQVLDDYDILADAGAAQTAVAKCFNVAVSDGSIDVDFRGVVGEAIVSAIVLGSV
jgi:beta-galactosidase